MAGSDDFSIRVYKSEELIFDINESAKIVHLSTIRNNLFTFALSNGTFGVYYSRKLLWKQKSEQKITALLGLDFTYEGEFLIAVGYEDGTVETRKHRKGEIINKSTAL